MTQVGSVYAQALYDLAREEGLGKRIMEELRALNESFSQNPEYLRLLSTPNLSKDERIQILDDGFKGKLQPYVLNFLKILTEKGYIGRFADCCEAFRDLYNEDNGILQVRAVTAVPMTEAQKKRLCEKLTGLTGKTIELQNAVDPECLGGVRLDYDGKRVDDTVQHRLDAVRSLLKNTML